SRRERRILERLRRITGNRVKAPGELAVLDIVGREKSADRILTAADADNDLSSLDDSRRHGDRVGHVFGRDADLPENLTGRYSERAQTASNHRGNVGPLIQCDAPIHDAAADPGLPDRLIDLRIGAPDFFLRMEIDGVDNAPGSDTVQSAVEDERSVFLMRLS